MGWQFYSWAKAGSWNTVAFSHLLDLADVSPPRTYAPASATSDRPAQERIDIIVEWLLDLPVIMPLLLALGLLTAFYVYLLSVEKELVRNQYATKFATSSQIPSRAIQSSLRLQPAR